MELIPIVENDKLVLKGFVERKWAEKNRLCHLTTLLIPVRREDGKVAIQTRPEKKSFAGFRDFFGGHVTFNQDFLPLLLGQEFNLESIILSAAIREANEELRIVKEDGYPEIVTKELLTMIRKIGYFSWDGKENVERSTLFLVKIPHSSLIRPMDDIDGKFEPVKTEFLTFEDVFERYQKKQWQFADGAERILKQCAEDKGLLKEIRDIIAAIPMEGRKKFRAVLWDYGEDSPGGGGLDSTLSYEQLPKTKWFDRYEDALEAGKKRNAECGYGFHVRIETEEVGE